MGIRDPAGLLDLEGPVKLSELHAFLHRRRERQAAAGGSDDDDASVDSFGDGPAPSHGGAVFHCVDRGVAALVPEHGRPASVVRVDGESWLEELSMEAFPTLVHFCQAVKEAQLPHTCVQVQRH